MVNKQVVLLYGKSSNGGTFLITNTGTPLSQVSNYGVTSLGNFMLIMKSLMSVYNSSSYTLADYFINTTLINNLNSTLGINIQAISLQPVLDGSISNSASVINCPNMWYLFLNNKNSVNLSIDPTNQIVFNESSTLYLGLNNAVLSDTGLCKYFNSELTLLGTGNQNNIPSTYFGNSLYLGLNNINSNSYYMLIILPEALFNGTPINNNNVMSIYSAFNTIFYFNFNTNSSSAFSPLANTVSNTNNTSSSTTVNTGNTSNSYSISKINLSVSNVQLL